MVELFGLATGTTSGKASFNPSDKPRFTAALIATILHKPSIVKWDWSSISWNACLNYLKSEHLCVINEYLSKWFIITFKSLDELTLKRNDLVFLYNTLNQRERNF